MTYRSLARFLRRKSRPPGDVSRRSETVIDNPVDSSPEDDLVAQLLEHSLDVSILASAVEAQQPADAADTLETLDESEAADILEEMELIWRGTWGDTQEVVRVIQRSKEKLKL